MITNSTLLIQADTNEYPLRLRDVKQRLKHVSFPQQVTESMLESFDYHVVTPTDRPTGDVVTEGDPELVDGQYRQAWNVRGYTAEELSKQFEQKQQEHRHEIDRTFTEAVHAGFPYDFDGVTQHVQIRSEDRVNLLTLRMEAEQVTDAQTPMEFRTLENQIVLIAAGDLIAMVDAALDYHKRLQAKAWELKDLTQQAVEVSGLPTIPQPLVVA